MFSTVVVDQSESWSAFKAISVGAVFASWRTLLTLGNGVISIEDWFETGTTVDTSVNLGWVADSTSGNTLDASFGILIVNITWLADVACISSTGSA